MTLEDPLYGQVFLREPVLVELLKSDAVQRLKAISMGGIVAILGVAPTTTRFEHSIGAMLLVRRLGGSIEEQVAALLHDVSHTSLSHVIDYVFDQVSTQDFHDVEKERYVRRTTIPSICDRHGLDFRKVLDETRYSLLEQPAPRLCADRIDYTLRDLEPLGLASNEEAVAIMANVTAVGGRMAFVDADSAFRFGAMYMASSSASWVNPRNLALYEICGTALLRAFEEGLIGRGDIWGSDDDLWLKLNQASKRSRGIAVLMDELTAGADFDRVQESQADLVARAKIRWIDPDVVSESGLVPLSKLSSKYDDLVAQYKKDNCETVFLRRRERSLSLSPDSP
jgi:uncharacterized protein